MANKKNKKEEMELLERVLAKDSMAFQDFYRQYFRLVITCIRKVFNRYSVDYDQDDVAETQNQVFLNLVKNDYRKLRKYDPEKGYKLSSWVGLISINTAYDILRKRKPETSSLDDDEHYLPEPVSEAPSPLKNLERKEQVEILMRAIEQLTDNERRFVELFYEHQLTHEEIAYRMSLSINTVYSKKNKIKNKLKKFLKQMGR
ncbi:MAG: RNA polymerase sigma factor [Myxococcota bacterium]